MNIQYFSIGYTRPPKGRSAIDPGRRYPCFITSTFLRYLEMALFDIFLSVRGFFLAAISNYPRITSLYENGRIA